MQNYGKELVLDLHNCSTEKFNREGIQQFFNELCQVIDMVQVKTHFWDDEDLPEGEEYTEQHLSGTTAIQFIETSNITIHTLDLMERVYLNIFSCKDFDAEKAKDFCLKYFEGKAVNVSIIDRI